MQNTKQKDIIFLIKSILDIDQKISGIDYLKQFIKNIANVLDVKYVLLGHPSDDQLSHIQTDIVWAVDDYIDNFTYQLKDTPCECVITGERVCIHEKNVCIDFPKDTLLQEMGIESYIGAPVLSKTFGQVSSILVLLDDKPMADRDFFISITDFLAIRASAEISQHYNEEILIKQVSKRTKELKDAKDEIELLNKNLEKRVQEEIEKNEKKQIIISQQSKMATMGEMIENIAHQWRQPLSIISTTSSAIKIKDEMDMLEENEIGNSMDDITQSVNYLSQTIDDFRNFFKADKCKTTFTLNNSFEKTLQLILPQFKNTEIEIVKNIEHVEIHALKNELMQVFINILNNARDELIKQEDQKRLILIDVEEKDSTVKISIKDNGSGIPKNCINDIFEQHFTTKEDTNGTGIGLYMSKIIIEEHMEGTIKASNIQFNYEGIQYIGALFTIELPIDFK